MVIMVLKKNFSAVQVLLILDDGKLEDIVAKEDNQSAPKNASNSSPLLVDILGDGDKETVYDKPCLICHL